MEVSFCDDLQRHLEEKVKQYQSTCSVPELAFNLIFKEKLTPEKVRNELIYKEFVDYIKVNRYGRRYIYEKLANKHNITTHSIRAIIAKEAKS